MGDLNKVVSDNDDVKMIMMMIMMMPIVKMLKLLKLAMFHMLVNLKYLSKEERNFLVAIKFELEKIRVLNKKQSHISDHFMLEQSFYDRFY